MDYLSMDYLFKLVLNNDNICISDKSYSIHGLWPDYANGSYPQYCNLENHCSHTAPCSNNLNSCNLNITPFISSDLYYNMTQYWCSYDQSRNINFWCHEWCKHGCCTDMNITEYFNTAMSLFLKLLDNTKITCYREAANKMFNRVNCDN